MMIFSLILAATASAPPAAARPSFDCVRAATPVERMICADPSLAARDRALAVAYRYRRSILDPTPQTQWLAERDACRTAGCIAAAYDRRFAETMGEVPILPGQFARSGQPGYLSMIDLGGGWYLFEISASYVYPRHDNMNTGGAAGVVRIGNGRGRWRGSQPGRDSDCILDFRRRPGAWSVMQISDCANGLYVQLSGLYRSISRARTRRR